MKEIDPNVLDQYVESEMQASLSTERYDKAFAYEHTLGLYELAGIPHPGVELFDGPGDVMVWVSEKLGSKVDFVLPPYTGFLQRGLVAAAKYLRTELGIEQSLEYELFAPCTDLCMVWAMSDVCLVSQPPLYYRHTPDYVVHCEDGPSMEYADGSKMWTIDGIDVDEQIVMRPSTQTIDQMVYESNTDVRAIRIDRFGWLPFLEQTDAQVLDERANDIEGTYETLFSSTVGNRFIATCNTGRIVSLGVPNSIQNCEDAQTYLRRGRKVNIIGRT